MVPLVPFRRRTALSPRPRQGLGGHAAEKGTDAQSSRSCDLEQIISFLQVGTPSPGSQWVTVTPATLGFPEDGMGGIGGELFPRHTQLGGGGCASGTEVMLPQ